MPDENIGPSPRTTTTRTESSAAAASIAAPSSRIVSPFSAFRFSGRLTHEVAHRASIFCEYERHGLSSVLQREGGVFVRKKAAHMETRDIAAILIGLQVGLVVGLLDGGHDPARPFAVGLLGAAVGFGVRRGRQELIRRALRSQLRAAR